MKYDGLPQVIRKPRGQICHWRRKLASLLWAYLLSTLFHHEKRRAQSTIVEYERVLSLLTSIKSLWMSVEETWSSVRIFT